MVGAEPAMDSADPDAAETGLCPVDEPGFSVPEHAAVRLTANTKVRIRAVSTRRRGRSFLHIRTSTRDGA
jgi:hypothetical protein